MSLSTSMTLLAILALGLSTLAADEPIVPEDAKLEKLWAEGEFTEGPAQGPDGCIYFSDIGTRLMKFDPATGKTTVFRSPSGRSNGLDFDAAGRLVAAEGANKGGNRRVTRTEKNGKITVLADKFDGKAFNSPNDLTIDKTGRIFFSDPRYVGDEPRELDHESVYRIDADGKISRIITDVTKPNGLALSPDMKTLYVAESNHSGKRQLRAYPLKEDGTVGAMKVLHDFGEKRGVDGMSVDEAGRIFATAGTGKETGVYIFSPAGKQLGFIPTPETATNCVFAGPDRNLLYITAGKSLYRIKTNTRGFAIYWPK
ncbi:MAG: SMP-30/gluconolactonase/LRE family protein [Gemmataceae bacterium]